jgi:carbon storage regulator CsrA
MLVLSRKLGEEIVVLGPCTVRVLEVRCDRAKLGFDADPAVKILRREIIDRENEARAKIAS